MLFLSYSLFKPANYKYGNARNSENTNAKRGIVTYDVTNNKKMNIEGQWRNKMQIAQYSDFNLLSVNDIISASANGKGIENAYSFPCVSKTSCAEGKLHIFFVIFLCKRYLQHSLHAITMNNVYS